MPRRRRGGMGWETAGSFSTRRRGDTEEDAEKQERDGGDALNSGVRREAEEAEKTEEGSPRFARIGRLKPNATWLSTSQDSAFVVGQAILPAAAFLGGFFGSEGHLHPVNAG